MPSRRTINEKFAELDAVIIREVFQGIEGSGMLYMLTRFPGGFGVASPFDSVKRFTINRMFAKNTLDFLDDWPR